MLIFALDDEQLLLDAAERAIKEAAPDAEISTFLRAEDAIKKIADEGIVPDVVFTDIEMPDMDGLDLAARIKELSCNSRIIFTTAYSEYAVEAYGMHANGYVLKPLMPDRIKEELELIGETLTVDQSKIEARCFGYFEVFWQGEPLRFRRKKTKELLALLIDRAGAMCTADEITTALWEDGIDARKAKDIIRHLVQDMRGTLKDIGMEAALIRRSGQMAIRCDMFDCDYFRMLNQEPGISKAFSGEYMNQYSWAEYTLGRLQL